VAAPPKPFRIVFPEGFTRLQMAARVKDVAGIATHERGRKPRLAEPGYLAASVNKRLIPGFGRRPLEGFLFPATYQFTERSSASQLVSAQLRTFRRNWSTINLAYARSKNLTPYDVLTIASMVEKEAVAPEERPKIARVIYNRLHDRMPLGIDATVRYAFHVPGTQSLLESQLNSNNPYNTASASGSRRRRSRIRGSRRSRRPPIRLRATGSTSSANRTRCTISSRRAHRRSTTTSAHTAT